MTLVQQWCLRTYFTGRRSAQAEDGRRQFDAQFSTNDSAQECACDRATSFGTPLDHSMSCPPTSFQFPPMKCVASVIGWWIR